MDTDNDARLRRADEERGGSTALAAKALSFDPERYRHHIAHMDMSAEAQAELLAVVWRMMRSFVDIAFGDDPTQLARIAGDKPHAVRESGSVGTLGFSHADKENERPLAACFAASGTSDWKERSLSDAAE